MAKPVCVVAGVGPGLGAALVRRFAAGGYAVAAMARRGDALKQAVGGVKDCLIVECDVGDERQVGRAYGRAQAELGPIEALLYNAGGGFFRGLDQLSAEDFSVQWRTNALGLFLAAKQVVPGMVERGLGVIGVTGATASLRGRSMTTGFAAGKAAQRSLAQSLARDLGPKGVHVFLSIIDGVIDLPRTRQMMPDQPDSFFLAPDEIAESYWNASRQGRSAWTFELDLRPHGESW